jgi:GNAT superfamily N-acetyltransferase
MSRLVPPTEGSLIILIMFQMIATAPEARGLGLATDLVQRSVQLAACLGFRGCKTEATGTYSRKAFQKCGFDLVADVKYAQFKIGEKTVFAGIQGHEGVAFMAKLLD